MNPQLILNKKIYLFWAAFCGWIGFAGCAFAVVVSATETTTPTAHHTSLSKNISIIVLDFELIDDTDARAPAEAIEREAERTASIAPQLRSILSTNGNYSVLNLPTNSDAAESGVETGTASHSYFINHPELAAQFARSNGANWIVIGQIRKPSYLFASLIAVVVNAQTGNRIGEWVIEMKGQQKMVTERGVSRMAEIIDQNIRAACCTQITR